MFNFLTVFTSILLSISCVPVIAQINPDESLGEDSSVVTPDVEVKGTTADRIDGGAIRDRHLFHSFSEFNVGESESVYFANPNNIDQIFTRVTGSDPSNILGTLGVDGAADLLLLNPNGIIFGENSSLDVEGSFFGTTADSVIFEDNTEFSATQPQSPLLTIGVPLGLQIGTNPGSIVVRSPLALPNGQNFSLVGGNIDLKGSNLGTDGISAPEGRIELGGLSTTGIVTFEDSSNLGFPTETSRANITLNNFILNTLGGGGGYIALYSQNLRLIDSVIETGIDSRVKSTQAQAGDITIDTIQATILESSDEGRNQILNITGDISEFSESINDAEVVNATGNAGNISINTGSFSANGLYTIASATEGEGNAGNITINAKESVFLEKPESSRPSSISSTSGELATGNGGNIIVQANSLSLSNVFFTTLTEGKGNAGNIQLDIVDSITLSNNSELEMNSLGQGNAGNLSINTATLAIQDSVVSAITNGSGQAGNLNITASDSISLEGEWTNSNGDTIPSRLSTATAKNGNAGDIALKTGNLTLIGGAFDGFIDIPNVNFLPNNLIELSEETINTDEVVSNSCVVPNQEQGGTFVVTGTGGLAVRPNDAAVSNYGTGDVRTLPQKPTVTSTDENWQPGEPIVEPEGMYRLSNGQLVLSRQCN
ncbi:MAG: filamentous hemagglutinin N-terminal domain-containing protein [Waterburya sp.]